MIYTASTGFVSAYNASSCADCHNAPALGGSSQITVTRAGHRDNLGQFVPVPNGGVLHKYFTDAKYYEHAGVEDIRGQRVAVNLLGDGYIEAIEDSALLKTAEEQRKLTSGRISGQVVYTPVLEAPGKTAVGRFGWKSQHASLLSSAADALRSELGINSRLYPSQERGIHVEDSIDRKATIDDLAAFIRETENQPRDEKLAASTLGRVGS